MSEPTLYEAVGGQPVLERLAERFYHHMDTLPEAAGIRALHQDDLTFDRHKLAAFLSGWLDGPPLYWIRKDHKQLRRHHRHLPVDPSAVRQWMLCMTHALHEVVEDDTLRKTLRAKFASAAAHIRNQ